MTDKTRQELYAEVDKAARRVLDNIRRAYESWVVIGLGWMEARREVIERLGNRRNVLSSQPYRLGITGWLGARSPATRQLLEDSAVRANLTRMMENFDDITQWRDKLPPGRRAELNHPTTVWRAFLIGDPERQAKKKAKVATQSAAATRAALREANATIMQKTAYIADLEAGRVEEGRTPSEHITAILDECDYAGITEITRALLTYRRKYRKGGRP